MAEERLRELERRWWESGGVKDEAALLAERVRVGELPREHLALAAWLGYEAARIVTVEDHKHFVIDGTPPLELYRRLTPPIEQLSGSEGYRRAVFASVFGLQDHACDALVAPYEDGLLIAESQVLAFYTDEHTGVRGVPIPKESSESSPQYSQLQRSIDNLARVGLDDESLPGRIRNSLGCFLKGSEAEKKLGSVPYISFAMRHACSAWESISGTDLKDSHPLNVTLKKEFIPWLLGTGDPIFDRYNSRQETEQSLQ